MSRFAKAILVSLAVHGLLAAALALYLDRLPLLELPHLDLSAVELSFSDEESPAADPAPPPPEPEPVPPPPEPDPPPPEPEPEPVPEPEPEPDPQPEPEPPPPEPEELPSPDGEAPPAPTPPPEPEELPSPDGEAPPSPTPPPEPEPPPPPEPVPPPPEPAPAQARIDAPPSATKPIRPVYPTGARQRREEGDVVLQLSISAHGRVTAASVFSSSGFPELDASALRAAKKARFVPAKSGRDAVAATVHITISFRLSQR